MKITIKKILLSALCMFLFLTTATRKVHADDEVIEGPVIIVTIGADVEKDYGDIVTPDDGKDFIGLGVMAIGAEADVTTGDIQSPGDGVITYSQGEAEVYLETGDIASTNGTGIVSKVDPDSMTQVTTGDIEAQEKGLEVYITGDDAQYFGDFGSITSEDDAVAINVKNEGVTKITTEDIDSQDDGLVISTDNGMAFVNVNGDLSAKDYPMIVNAEGENDVVFVSVAGTIYGEKEAPELNADGYKSIVMLSVDEDVISQGDGLYLYAQNEGAVIADIDNDVVSQEAGAYLYTAETGSIMLLTNNIKAEEVGLVISNYGESEIAVRNQGVITGSVSAILIDQDEEEVEDNAHVLTWGLNVNERGNVAEYTDLTSPDWTAGIPAKNFEKNGISYLIKMLQPENGEISVTDENGDQLPTYTMVEGDEDIDVPYASQDQKVLVKVNPAENYSIKGVYNGDGEKVDLLVDDDGNYYVIIPKGGKVYLTAELELNDYSIISETETDHIIGSGEVHYIEIAANVDEFDSVYVDQKDVTDEATVTEGSTIVTLPSSLLDKLSIGSHDLMVRFLGGHEVTSKFNVWRQSHEDTDDDNTTVVTDSPVKTVARYNSPGTGVDSYSVTNNNKIGVLPFGLLLVAAITLKKKNDEEE